MQNNELRQNVRGFYVSSCSFLDVHLLSWTNINERIVRMLQQENSQAFSCFRSSTKVPKFSSNAAFGTTWGLKDMLLPSGNPAPIRKQILETKTTSFTWYNCPKITLKYIIMFMFVMLWCKLAMRYAVANIKQRSVLGKSLPLKRESFVKSHLWEPNNGK